MKTKSITCQCGRIVECHSFTNTCDCGRDYNWAGRLRAPRSQWGEETGEHWADIANIDSTPIYRLFNDDY